MTDINSSIKQSSVRCRLETIRNERRLAEVGKNLGSITHDMRSPLQAFELGLESLEHLMQSSPLRNTQIEQMEVILAQLKTTYSHMNALLNRSLDLIKLQSDVKLTPNLEVFDLNTLVDRVMICVDSFSDEVGLEICRVPEDTNTLLLSDKSWLEDNLLCLIANAIKFSSSCALVRVAFTIIESAQSSSSANEAPCMLRIEVDDTGLSIDESTRSLLFQGPVGVQGSGGSGLGLYTLARRVEALGGSYGSSNRSDGIVGSIFWFMIPYFPQSSTRSSQGSGTPTVRQSFSLTLSGTMPDESFLGQASPVSPSGQPNRILVVEDSLPILKMTAKVLEHSGYVVDQAMNGSAAVDFVSRNNYSLVLMDIQMPVMDGLEATKKIREMENDHVDGKKSLIIGVSANPESILRVSADLSGMNGFIPKPFNMSRLSEVLQNVQIQPKIEENFACKIINEVSELCLD